MCGVHDFAGDVVEVCGGEGVDLCESLLEGYDVAGVEVVFCHAECGVLEVVGSNAELPLELAFGGGESAGGEGGVDESVELAVDESEAAADIRVVAAEVDAPDSGVGIGIDVGFQTPIQVYAPVGDEHIDMNDPSESFNQDELYSPGIAFNVNQQKYDSRYVLTSLRFARNLFHST